VQRNGLIIFVVEVSLLRYEGNDWKVMFLLSGKVSFEK